MKTQKSIQDFCQLSKPNKRNSSKKDHSQSSSPPHKRREVTFNYVSQIFPEEEKLSKDGVNNAIDSIDNEKESLKSEAIALVENKFDVKIEAKDSFLHKQLIAADNPNSEHEKILEDERFKLQSSQSEINKRKALLNVSTEIPTIVKSTSFIQSTKLFLPSSLLLLSSLFSAMESVCMFNAGRDQLCIFSKVKKALENIVNRNISANHIAAIRYFYPEAFLFKSISVAVFGRQIRSFSFELKANNTDFKMGHEGVVQRREELHKRLLNYANVFHNEYLESIQMKPIELNMIKEWHRKCPIETIRIPFADASEEESVGFLFSQSTEIKDAKRNESELKNEDEGKYKNEDKNNDSNISTSEQKALLNHKVSEVRNSSNLSLLERIRLKEKSQMQNSLLKNEKIIQNSNDFHFSLIDSLFLIFNSSKKTILSQTELCDKLSVSHKSFASHQEIWKEIVVLSERISKWIQIVQLKSDFYLKVVAKMTLSEIKQLIKR